MLLLMACSTPAGSLVTAKGDTAELPAVDTVVDSPADSPADSPPVDTDTGCAPRSCEDVGATCGALDDGCGASLDCGGCDAWYGCEANQCVAASCIPTQEDSTDGGGKCSSLAQAWTARGINVGYYPFKVLRDTPQYSGDYGGDGSDTLTPGGSTAGVLLQVIPAGAYVGLSSTGPWYNSDGECYPDGTCGDADVGACADSAPPLRPGLSGWYWGYGQNGASHMQGWVYMDPTALEFAGFDPGHPCVLGPAGLDYEVSSACGAPTTCDGSNRTCAEANPCDEGGDDCGAESCGAESGGSLTPSAHRGTITYPDDAKACTEGSPPDPRVLCLDNGTDIDHYYVYPHGAYLYWAQDSTTKAWVHYGDTVQAYYHTRDGSGVLWDFIEVLSSGAPTLTPASDGAGAGCTADDPSTCTPCKNGGTCGWIQDVFVQ